MPQNAKFGTAAVLQVLFNDIDVDDIIGFTVTILQVYSIKLIRAIISGNLNRIFIKVGSNRRTVTNHIFICQQTIARIVEFGLCVS